jgi:hypothetical protein
MPQLIEHIDAIARAKGRDVLFVIFHQDLRDRIAWELLPVRQQIVEWLTANAIAWKPCGQVASTSFVGPYLGQIYVDVPFDTGDPTYRRLRDYLEKPDGSMALDGAAFCYLPLSEAMKNAHHDEPGFWENQYP